MGLKDLLKAGARLIDPGRDYRIKNAAQAIHDGLASERERFDLIRCASGLELFQDELTTATEATYGLFVARAWKDAVLTDGERKGLAWVARKLGISAVTVQRIEQAECFAVIRRQLTGELHAIDTDNLKRIAGYVGMELGEIVRAYFIQEAGDILRLSFGQAVADGHISQAEWDELKSVVVSLGLTWNDFLTIVHPQAERFVEQMLADARADGVISADEKRWIVWALDRLIIAGEFTRYIREQVAMIEARASIEAGRLPSISSSAIGLRAGEIIHAERRATWHKPVVRQNGPQTISFDGILTLTDSRLLFLHATSPVPRHQPSPRRRYDRILRRLQPKCEWQGLWRLRDWTGRWAVYADVSGRGSEGQSDKGRRRRRQAQPTYPKGSSPARVASLRWQVRRVQSHGLPGVRSHHSPR
jgi:tellurite resistance protein